MEPTQHDVPVPAPRSERTAERRSAPARRGRGQVRAIARAAGRTCSRPGCDTPASATLVFSYQEQVARLVDLLDEGEPQAYDLCPVHADRTRPPVGWELADTRPPRGDTPRRLDDEETVAVLAAALRGETPPTRVSVVEGEGQDSVDAAEQATDEEEPVRGVASTPEGDEDPLRAALEELQRVAMPDDEPTAPATPLRTRSLVDAEDEQGTGPAEAGDLAWTDLDLDEVAAAAPSDGDTADESPTLW